MVLKKRRGAQVSLINDYTHQLLTDQRERDLARLAEHNRQVRLALGGRFCWWRRLVARRKQRIVPVIMSILGPVPDPTAHRAAALDD
jgi:hypothetical protein